MKKKATGDNMFSPLANILNESKKLLSKEPLCVLLEEWERLYIAVYQSGFSVFVTGAFSSGKTTLINKIVQNPVIPVEMAQGKLLFTSLRYGPKATVFQLPAKSDKELPWSRQNWERVKTSGGGETITIGIKTPDEWLQRLSCEFVDTPAIGEPADRITLLIAEPIALGDAVLFTVSATMALSQNELAFLETFIAQKKIPRTAIVLTRMDQIPSKDRIALVQYVKMKLENLDLTMPVYVPEEKSVFPNNEFHELAGINNLRKVLESWAVSKDHPQRRFTSLCFRTGEFLKKAIFLLKEQQQSAALANEAIRESLEHANYEIDHLGLIWENIRLEMGKRGVACQQFAEDSLNQGRKDILDQVKLGLLRSNQPKEYAEKELPLLLEKQLKHLLKTLEEAVQKRLSADNRWFTERIKNEFLKDILIASPPGLFQNSKTTMSLDTKKFEDLQRSRQVSRIATGLVSIGFYLLTGPLGIVVSIGGGIISDTIISGKIKEQKEQLRAAINRQVHNIFKEATSAAARQISEFYDQSVAGSKEHEALWVKFQHEFFAGQPQYQFQDTAESDQLTEALQNLIINLNRIQETTDYGTNK